MMSASAGRDSAPTRSRSKRPAMARLASLRLGLAHPDLFGALGAHSVIVFGSDGPLVDNWLAAIPAGRMPRIYLDLGDSDSGLANARKFEVELTAADIPHEWHVNIGYHDETYWSAHVLEYLQWYAADW